MPTRAWYALRNQGQFRIGFTLNAAIGQGDDDRHAAAARARVRRARQRRHALPAAARPRGRDERRRGRAGVSRRACARQVDVAPENLAPRHRSALRRRQRGEGHGVPGARSHARRRGQDGHRADRLRREEGATTRRRPGTSREPRLVRRASRRRKAPEIAVVVLVEHGGSGPDGRRADRDADRARVRAPAGGARRAARRPPRRRRIKSKAPAAATPMTLRP